jgi:SAM-dependent methyltransferase
VCRLDQNKPGDQETCAASSQNLDEIRNVIKNKYAEVSISAAGKFEYPTGKDGAIALGYDPAIISSAAPGFLESFCGVGNPFSLGKIEHGDVVLDFGSGAGFDLFVASRLVGETGRVCGVDLTEQMVERSQNNLADANISNAEIRKVDSENVPYANDTFDVVISNGVINLSPSKDICFREIYRILKPGGRLQFADVVLENEMPSDLSGSLEAWSQ